MPPITNVAVQRPFIPAFLRDKRQHECDPALSEAARVIACWEQQLGVHPDLKLRLLVVEKAPFHSEEHIAQASRSAVAIFVCDFDWKLQLELNIRQSVVQIEQRRVHLSAARSALDDERNVDFPSARWRRLRIIRNKWWAPLARN